LSRRSSLDNPAYEESENGTLGSGFSDAASTAPSASRSSDAESVGGQSADVENARGGGSGRKCLNCPQEKKMFCRGPCWHCGEQGHVKKDCPSLKRKRRQRAMKAKAFRKLKDFRKIQATAAGAALSDNIQV
jgi:hypothetical protein